MGKTLAHFANWCTNLVTVRHDIPHHTNTGLHICIERTVIHNQAFSGIWQIRLVKMTNKTTNCSITYARYEYATITFQISTQSKKNF